jgi:serine/threonine protein kinase
MPLGQGRFSTVYQCKNIKTQEVAAVKFIDKTNISDKEKLLLREEIDIVKTVHHPNIVAIKEVFETEESVHIVME